MFKNDGWGLVSFLFVTFMISVFTMMLTPGKVAALETSESTAESDKGRTLRFSVDFSQTCGPIKPLNGTNLGPRLSTNTFNDQARLFNDAKFSFVRLHDAPWDNPTNRLVDTPLIFGNFHADATDPENYYFEATDDYLRSILDGGAKILYRLGTSIEHSSPNTYFTKEPEWKQFAEICAGIIRHYNEGWANGYHWNIQYWEIWNEPNIVPMMWDSEDFSTYCRFYVNVAKRLRAEFPDIKIGGPAMAGSDVKTMEQFADACREADAPLDFCSWHGYPSDPDIVVAQPQKMRDCLDARGFQNAELHFDEWHYFPGKWSEVMGKEGGRARREEVNNGDSGMNGIDSAAFCANLLSRWQDTPLDYAYYYSTALIGMDDWGLIDGYGYPRKTYYVFRAFGEMIESTPERVKCAEVPAGFSILAGIGSHGQKRILVASFKESSASMEIELNGVPASGNVLVETIAAGPSAEPVTSNLSYTDGVIKLEGTAGSVVRILRWDE